MRPRQADIAEPTSLTYALLKEAPERGLESERQAWTGYGAEGDQRGVSGLCRAREADG